MPRDRSNLVTLVISKWQSLLITGDGWWSVYDMRPQHYAKHNRTVFNCMHSGKSEAEVTNKSRVRLRQCTVEANHWQTWSIVWPHCDNRASGYQALHGNHYTVDTKVIFFNTTRKLYLNKLRRCSVGEQDVATNLLIIFRLCWRILL